MAERTPASGDLSLVLTTLPDAEAAERLSRVLLDERLIACGNVISGVVSLFHWQGAVQREAETLLLMKTPAELVERLFRRAAELHPYEVPELISIRADDVESAYSCWARRETTEVNA